MRKKSETILQKITEQSACRDCGAPTIGKPSESYMVRDDVWKQSGMRKNGGRLCVGCLEKRIGRRLVKEDFTDVPLNGGIGASDRLLNRLGLLNEAELNELRVAHPKAYSSYIMLKADRDRLCDLRAEMICILHDLLQTWDALSQSKGRK